MPRFLTKTQLAVMPTANEVVYEPPAPADDPQPKACSNCALWAQIDRCMIHAKDLVVLGFDNCSYHVPGKPSKRSLPLVMDPPLTPAQTGLGLYPGGTRCASCMHFSADERFDGAKGDCLRVRQDDAVEYASVDANGCCARYVKASWFGF